MARDLAYVLGEINAGKTIRFHRDYYGRQKVEIRSAWIWRTTVQLADYEIMTVRDALQRRRRIRAASVNVPFQTKRA